MQVRDNPKKTNTNHTRMLDCLYLRGNNSKQLGVDLLYLPTNIIIQQNKIWSILVTTSIIEQVYIILVKKKIRKRLKISTYAGVILYDSALTTGVNHTTDLESDEISLDSNSEIS